MNLFPEITVESERDLIITHQSLKKFKDEMKNIFDQKFGTKKFILFLQGPSGCGKKVALKQFCKDNNKKIYEMHTLKQNKVIPIVKQQQTGFFQFQNDSNQSQYLLELEQERKNLQQSPLDFLKDAIVRASQYNLYKDEVILIDDFPVINNIQQRKQFGEYLKNLEKNIKIQKQPYNLIVFSINNTIYPESQIKKLFEFHNIFQIQYCTSYDFKAPTAIQIKKQLTMYAQKIARKRNINLKSNFKDKLEEIVQLSNGDISISMNELYMLLISSQKPKNQIDGKVKKDTEIGLYHAIGKFLYNKRVERNKFGELQPDRQYSREEMERMYNLEFYFDPWHMIQQTPCDKDVFRNFLQQNYLDFYGDIEDVAEQADQFAQCDILSKNNFKSEKDERFRMENKQFNTYLSGLGILVNNRGFTEQQIQQKKQQKGQFKPLIRSCDIEMYKFNQQFKQNYSKLQQDYPKQLSKVSRKTFIIDYFSPMKNMDPIFLKKQYQIDFQSQNSYNNNSNYIQQNSLSEKWKKGGTLQEKDFKTEEENVNENTEQQQQEENKNDDNNNQQFFSQNSQNNSNNLNNKYKYKNIIQEIQAIQYEDDIEECE